MNRTIICSIPMKQNINQVIYPSKDKYLPTSDRPVSFTINAHLEMILEQEDNVKVILVLKKNGEEHYLSNCDLFKSELNEINKDIGAKITYVTIESDFSEGRRTHEGLLSSLIDNIDDNSEIIADITYGPKDVPIVIFTALEFAENHLDCNIQNIVYGQADHFENNKPVGTQICTMTSLFTLNNVANVINDDSPEKSRKILKTLLSI